MKEWKSINWGDACPECGSDVEVLTDCKIFNNAYDGDLARCTECKRDGWVCVVDDDYAYINWTD